jgi:hypothetical protein
MAGLVDRLVTVETYARSLRMNLDALRSELRTMVVKEDVSHISAINQRMCSIEREMRQRVLAATFEAKDGKGP